MSKDEDSKTTKQEQVAEQDAPKIKEEEESAPPAAVSFIKSKTWGYYPSSLSSSSSMCMCSSYFSMPFYLE